MDSGLEAKTLFEELQLRYPGQFGEGQLRTLQRRVREWRCRCGPPQEVYFPQVRSAGEQCQSDFTDMRRVGVCIDAEPYAHLCYHFVLPYSNWEWVVISPSESFEALTEGMQWSLWELGGVPREHRTDNLSAATHALKRTAGREYNERYLEFLSHYGMTASTSTPLRPHENGTVESMHGGFRRALDQRLRLRGSREFVDRECYQSYLLDLCRQRNARRQERVATEKAVLRRLPTRRLPTYSEEFPLVTRNSTTRVRGNTYSVPSRLIGERLCARVYAARVEFWHGGAMAVTHERLKGQSNSRVDYRHVSHSLVRKPGAFARYRWREDMFPTLSFRQAYDRLLELGSRRGDVEYVRVLHLAATSMESSVDMALREMLAEGVMPDYRSVRERVNPVADPEPPEVTVAAPELKSYDELLAKPEALA